MFQKRQCNVLMSALLVLYANQPQTTRHYLGLHVPTGRQVGAGGGGNGNRNRVLNS
jgi:hypothetical protein